MCTVFWQGVALKGVHHVVLKSAAGCGLKKFSEYKKFLDRCQSKYNQQRVMVDTTAGGNPRIVTFTDETTMGKVYDISELKKNRIVDVLEQLEIFPERDFSEDSELSSTEDSQ